MYVNVFVYVYKLIKMYLNIKMEEGEGVRRW